MSEDRPGAEGSCLCGAVRFRVEGRLKPVIGCHCTECRKHTSHFLAFTAAWRDEFAIADETELRWYRSSAHSRRGFCATCGSTLFFLTDGDEKISIAAGSLDRAPSLTTTAAHLFVSEKGAYYALDDEVPQFERGGDQVPMPPKS